jgi:acyl-CoA synthetase (AMP-forming)/AMP-acid ligase II
MTLAYATHRLSGVASPANAAYSAAELEFQLKNSGSKALFTVSRFNPQHGMRANHLSVSPF